MDTILNTIAKKRFDEQSVETFHRRVGLQQLWSLLLQETQQQAEGGLVGVDRVATRAGGWMEVLLKKHGYGRGESDRLATAGCGACGLASSPFAILLVHRR